jgi:uncharacterized protein (TIGR00251 family)
MIDTKIFCREQNGALTITIHAQPGAKKSEVVGLHGEALKVRLAARPVEGAANEELIRFFSELLGIAQNRLRLARGGLSRHKVLEISGLTRTEFEQKLK